jgi:hypothetical protein
MKRLRSISALAAGTLALTGCIQKPISHQYHPAQPAKVVVPDVPIETYLVPGSAVLDLNSHPVSTRMSAKSLDGLLEEREGVYDSEERDRIVRESGLKYDSKEAKGNGDIQFDSDRRIAYVPGEEDEEAILRNTLTLKRYPYVEGGTTFYTLPAQKLEQVTPEMVLETVRNGKGYVAVPVDRKEKGELENGYTLAEFNTVFQKANAMETTKEERTRLTDMRRYDAEAGVWHLLDYSQNIIAAVTSRGIYALEINHGEGESSYLTPMRMKRFEGADYSATGLEEDLNNRELTVLHAK